MSFQFGRCYFDRKDLREDGLALSSDLVFLHGPDGELSYHGDGVDITYSAFHTTVESRSEQQPYHSRSGRVFTWDGRLDNRTELRAQLGAELDRQSSDVAIAAAAYDRWSAGAFGKLTGDWVLSIWDPAERLLILAKDVIGVRRLYWHMSADHVSWSTELDAIVQAETFPPVLDEEYIAGWFSYYPAPHVTPYTAVRAVSPGSFVSIRRGESITTTFGMLDRVRPIRYPKDADYEEHFRSVFAESVKRRLRSDRPVLAELSGGMDSSSIVCMADTLIARAQAETAVLSTVSFYDPSEPNWDERPYFTAIEKNRGRRGLHVDVSNSNCAVPGLKAGVPSITPIRCEGQAQESAPLAEYLRSNGCRIVLSGIGGDEMTGGVPTPIPELADLLARRKFGRLMRRGTEWAIAIRQPCLHLLWSTCRSFLPQRSWPQPSNLYAAKWLSPAFVKRHGEVLCGYDRRLHVLGAPPSLQENLSTLGALQRQLACSGRRTAYPYETRYPYLDRDLLEFLFAIPREQLVRPGQRRSLMRRALRGIVPQEVLERKRKAFILRGPMLAIRENWPVLEAFTRHMVSEDMGILHAAKFQSELLTIREGHIVPMVPVLRTLLIEQWLRTNAQSNPADILRLGKRENGWNAVRTTTPVLLGEMRSAS